MKKIFSFFSLLLILFLVLACELPSKVQIKGSPSLTFALDYDFSEMFREMMQDAFYDSESDRDNLVIQDCINVPEWITFLIRVGLVDFDQEIEGTIGDAIVLGGNFTLPNDVKLIDTETTLLFSEFGNFLKDFNFKTDEIESSLFINGSDDAIFKDIIISLDFVDSQGDVIRSIINKEKITNNPSGIDLNDNKYYEKQIPGGGVPVDVTEFFDNKEDIVIKLVVFLKAGTSYPVALLDKLKEHNKLEIDVEFVIWLPLFFTSDTASELVLPGFEGMGDFLVSLSESGVIEYLNLKIGLSKNPFGDGIFFIRDTDEYEIPCPMNETTIGFELSEKDIKHINDRKDEFAPEFGISFDEGTDLGIPRTLKIMTVSLDARINYIIGGKE